MIIIKFRVTNICILGSISLRQYYSTVGVNVYAALRMQWLAKTMTEMIGLFSVYAMYTYLSKEHGKTYIAYHCFMT